MINYRALRFQKLEGDKVILEENHDIYLERHRTPAPKGFDEYGARGWTPVITQTIPLSEVQKDYRTISKQIKRQTDEGPKIKSIKTSKRSWVVTNYFQWNAHFTSQLRPLIQTQKTLERILGEARKAT